MRRPFIHLLCAGLLAAGTALAQELQMQLEPDWEYVADTVMGGVSTGGIEKVTRAGKAATELTGEVSLDNNGGFIQMAFDLAPDGGAVDLSAYRGIAIDVLGDGGSYELRLRTTDLTRPWQSYRVEITAPPDWTTLELDFAEFAPHRTEIPLDRSKLRRMGVLAIGEETSARVAVADVRLIPAP